MTHGLKSKIIKGARIYVSPSVTGSLLGSDVMSYCLKCGLRNKKGTHRSGGHERSWNDFTRLLLESTNLPPNAIDWRLCHMTTLYLHFKNIGQYL